MFYSLDYNCVNLKSRMGISTYLKSAELKVIIKHCNIKKYIRMYI